MKLTTLKTHWTPEDAHAILGLLDELSDVLWNTYGDEIQEHYQIQHKTARIVSSEVSNNDEDLIPF